MPSYDKLDNEELLRLALEATNRQHHADAVAMLKTMLEREPDHLFATYLLAAEHAQMGLMEREEEGFKRTVELGPDFQIARFQLGQIHLTKGDSAAAKAVLAPLSQLPADKALGGYARGLIAATDEDLATAIAQIEAGLACDQEIPALAEDMRRMLGNLRSFDGGAPGPTASSPTPATPLFLSKYGKPAD